MARRDCSYLERVTVNDRLKKKTLQISKMMIGLNCREDVFWFICTKAHTTGDGGFEAASWSAVCCIFNYVRSKSYAEGGMTIPSSISAVALSMTVHFFLFLSHESCIAPADYYKYWLVNIMFLGAYDGCSAKCKVNFGDIWHSCNTNACGLRLLWGKRWRITILTTCQRFIQYIREVTVSAWIPLSLANWV